ncbi:MAG: EAL domain-containing protein [Gammaproteobacteria bacterium]|nr:MAG: EAL domain-containing protein [Gammaproteobacteria bacterium]
MKNKKDSPLHTPFPDDASLPSFRRAILAIGLATVLLLLAGSIGVSAWMKRTHLQAQLADISQDAATSLGFALSANRDLDPVLSDMMVDAMFNGGNYSLIEFVNVKGEPVVTRRANAVQSVPDWFRAWLPLQVAEGRADVVSGWRRLGSVRVQASLEAAYLEMWRTLVNFSGWFVLVTLGVVVLLGVILGRLLAPLGRMEEVALQLAEGDLNVTWPSARYRELARVRHALARMSHRLSEIFREQLAHIEQLRTEVMQDGVTGLPNRKAFLAQLRLVLETMEEGRSGTLVLIRFDAFARYNREAGHSQGDILLKQMADVVCDTLVGQEGAFAGRLKAAEFALFLAGMRAEELEGKWMEDMLGRIRLCPALQGQPVEGLGAALLQVAPGDAVGEVMAAADQALGRALDRTSLRPWCTGEMNGHGGGLISAADWREEIEQALLEHRVNPMFQPVLGVMGQHVLHHQVSTCLRLEDDTLTAAQFLPLASRFGLVERLDRHVLYEVIRLLDEDPRLKLSVPLAVETLRAQDFVDWLRHQLADHPGVGARLILDVPEAGIVHAWASMDALARARGQMGYALSVSQFGGAGQPFGYIQRWRPDWLRLDGALCLRTHEEPDNRFYMEALIKAAHSQDARVVAMLVENAQQAETWRELGVDAVMGYYLARPQSAPVHLG